MRVIAGSAKRLQLKTISGMDTRPTTDRIKETLFNMIAPELFDCCFLDLFAGSGAIGIEALSRGAKEAVFVEQNPKAVQCINDNLVHTHLEERAQVKKEDVLGALGRMEGTKKFDFIFMDPPYGQDWEHKVLKELADSTLLDEDTTIIIEAEKETSFSYLEELGYVLSREKLYKTNKHVFVHRIR